MLTYCKWKPSRKRKVFNEKVHKIFCIYFVSKGKQSKQCNIPKPKQEKLRKYKKNNKKVRKLPFEKNLFLHDFEYLMMAAWYGICLSLCVCVCVVGKKLLMLLLQSNQTHRDT